MVPIELETGVMKARFMFRLLSKLLYSKFEDGFKFGHVKRKMFCLHFLKNNSDCIEKTKKKNLSFEN